MRCQHLDGGPAPTPPLKPPGEEGESGIVGGGLHIGHQPVAHRYIREEGTTRSRCLAQLLPDHSGTRPRGPRLHRHPIPCCPQQHGSDPPVSPVPWELGYDEHHIIGPIQDVVGGDWDGEVEAAPRHPQSTLPDQGSGALLGGRTEAWGEQHLGSPGGAEVRRGEVGEGPSSHTGSRPLVSGRGGHGHQLPERPQVLAQLGATEALRHGGHQGSSTLGGGDRQQVAALHLRAQSLGGHLPLPPQFGLACHSPHGVVVPLRPWASREEGAAARPGPGGHRCPGWEAGG